MIDRGKQRRRNKRYFSGEVSTPSHHPGSLGVLIPDRHVELADGEIPAAAHERGDARLAAGRNFGAPFRARFDRPGAVEHSAEIRQVWNAPSPTTLVLGT